MAGASAARWRRSLTGPLAPAWAACGLAAAVALLFAGLQAGYRPPPLHVVVPIHDGTLPAAAEPRLTLPPVPRSGLAAPPPVTDAVSPAMPGERNRIALPQAPELAAALARGPGVRVAGAAPDAGDDGGASAMPALPGPGVAVGTLSRPPAPGQPGPVPPPAPAAPSPTPVAGGAPLLPVLAPAPPRPAWTRFAQPFAGIPGRPLIAIVLWGLGRDAGLAEAAIDGLPGAVTLGMAPGVPRPQYWADRARAAGHELLVEVPMEPLGYPGLDPGPGALLTELPAEENRRRLDVWLDSFEGHIGATNLMGSRFTASPEHVRPVLEHLKARGLAFLDSRATGDSVGHALAGEIGLDRAVNNRYIDNEPAAAAIDGQLGRLELTARANGRAIGIGAITVLTMGRLDAWIATLEDKGLQLAPLSAALQREDSR